MSPFKVPDPVSLLRGEIIERVRAIFNDRTTGQQPVPRSDEALFPENSVIWRVHGDVTAMMVGGMSALLLQMLHPAALAGILDHSNFRTDMLGRLRRTARFIAVTTYGERQAAEAAIQRVRSIHEAVRGELEDGRTYEASDPKLLAWVHVCEATSFVNAWKAYAEPWMTRRHEDLYFSEIAIIARKLGADPVPVTRAGAVALMDDMRPALVASPQCKALASLILAQRPPGVVTRPTQAVLAQAAVDLLPAWARRQLGLQGSGAGAGFVHAATFGVAATLRWAFTPAARPFSRSLN